MEDYRFFRLLFGPIHFKSRTLPFLINNSDTLNNYVYLVDNCEYINQYKDKLNDVIRIDDIRKNHYSFCDSYSDRKINENGTIVIKHLNH